MRVDHIKYKYILELIEHHLKTTRKNPSTDKNLQGKTSTKVPGISAEVIRLLSSLTDSERKTLITTWLKLNLPFDSKPLSELIALLKTTPDKEESLTRIKAFALIYKNKLPLLPHLIIGLSRYLNPLSPLTNELSQFLKSKKITSPENEQLAQKSSKPSEGEQKNFVKNLLSKLIVDMSETPEKLATELKEYPAKLQETLEYLHNNPEKAKPELYNQLLGQQIINNHEKNLLLALEFPFFFPDYNKLFPGYLQIWRGRDENKDNAFSQDVLKITFLISLAKRGLIRADALYKTAKNGPPSIKIGFQCSSTETKELAEERIPILRRSLEELGLQVRKIAIELKEQAKDQETKSGIHNFYEGLFRVEKKSNLPQIKHINFRV